MAPAEDLSLRHRPRRAAGCALLTMWCEAEAFLLFRRPTSGLSQESAEAALARFFQVEMPQEAALRERVVPRLPKNRLVLNSAKQQGQQVSHGGVSAVVAAQGHI